MRNHAGRGCAPARHISRRRLDHSRAWGKARDRAKKKADRLGGGGGPRESAGLRGNIRSDTRLGGWGAKTPSVCQTEPSRLGLEYEGPLRRAGDHKQAKLRLLSRLREPPDRADFSCRSASSASVWPRSPRADVPARPW